MNTGIRRMYSGNAKELYYSDKKCKIDARMLKPEAAEHITLHQ